MKNMIKNKEYIRKFYIFKNSKNNMIFLILILFLLILIIYPKMNILSVPNYLEKGDLLFCDFDPDFINKLEKFNITHYQPYKKNGYGNDHVAMYIGDNMFVESCPYHWDEDEHNWIGVVTSHIGLFNLWGDNITYGIINNATTNQKHNAVNWALDKLGDPYSYLNCGELITESYKNQDIDLCPNKYFITPYSLIQSEQITIIENKNNGFWYPTMYLKFYFICLFDYIEDIFESILLKDFFYFIQSIIT